MPSLHPSIHQSQTIALYLLQQLLLIMLVYHLFHLMIKIFLMHSLNINKAHGYDNLSIRLLKLCDSSIVKPLLMTFKNCLQSGSFPNNWKKSNVVPINKKGDKQLLQNCWPISLLPICGKIVFSVQINLVFIHLTHVKTNYYQSFMIFMLILINIQLLK